VIRVRARVEGTVQGVGFRPFVHRLAGELDLAGWVLNDERGVLLEVEGEAGSVDSFMRRLAADAPPLAAVESVTAQELAATGDRGFAIMASERGGPADAPVSPDSATCDDCLRELFDPADRRYRYPFINCTNCGPRFTIVRGVPYDRPTGASTRSRMHAQRAGRRCRCRWPPLLTRSGPAGSRRSRVWAAITSPLVATTRPPWRRSGAANTERTSPLR
jgi:hydrogenase maturation factor HypF (carbamoyltransferase family)